MASRAPTGLRDIGDPGTSNRLGTTPRHRQVYPPFSLVLLSEQSQIPDALAYALKWQVDLERTPEDHLEKRQELAANLLHIFDFLLKMQQQVERDPADGALLYRDPLKLLSARTGRTRIVELSDGTAIPVTTDESPEELPPWSPSLFPPHWNSKQKAEYPARPRHLLRIPPFDSPVRMGRWIKQARWKPIPQPPAGPVPLGPGAKPEPGAAKGPGVAVIEPEAVPVQPVDDAALDQALDGAATRFAQLTPEELGRYGAAPLVTEAIATLSRLTMSQLRAATGADVRSPWEDDKLISHTYVLLYHSVYTVVLNARAEPNKLSFSRGGRGLLDYAILVPPPGSQMRRALPQPGGLNISVQRHGDSTFHVESGTITKVLFGGVGAYQEFGYGYSGKHDLQEALERYLIDRQGYAACVTARAAFTPADLTVDRVYLRVGELAEAAFPHLLREITERLKARLENWEETAAAIGKELLIDLIKEKIRDYLIKKIGKRIIPVVNVASAIYDAAFSEEENTRIRHAIACALLAVRGQTTEDIEMAARVVSHICADEFEDQILQQVVRHAAKLHKPLTARRSKPGPHGASDEPTAPGTDTPPKPAQDQQVLPTHGSQATSPLESEVDAKARAEADAYVRDKAIEAVQQSRAQDKTQPSRGTGDKGRSGSQADDGKNKRSDAHSEEGEDLGQTPTQKSTTPAPEAQRAGTGASSSADDKDVTGTTNTSEQRERGLENRPASAAPPPNAPPSRLNKRGRELAIEVYEQAEAIEAGLPAARKKDPRYPNLEAEKTVAYSLEGGIPIHSGYGQTRTYELAEHKATDDPNFPQIQSRGGDPTLRGHAAEGVTRYEELSGKRARGAGRDDQGVPGSYYAHHAEVKERIAQIDAGTNGITGVSKPMCAECRSWHRAVARRRQQTLAVADPLFVRYFNPDGTVDVFYGHLWPVPELRGKLAQRVNVDANVTRGRSADASPW